MLIGLGAPDTKYSEIIMAACSCLCGKEGITFTRYYDMLYHDRENMAESLEISLVCCFLLSKLSREKYGVIFEKFSQKIDKSTIYLIIFTKIASFKIIRAAFELMAV